jgi:hypothetical protein
VSTVRRSTGPESLGKPEMNRSAKGGARSSLSFDDEGVGCDCESGFSQEKQFYHQL